MDRTITEILERPFPAELHRSRRGSYGKDIVYVEVNHYIGRLNEAFESDWSFDILEHNIHDSEVVVVGRLNAAGLTKTAFGGSSITVARESGNVVSVADDLKAAASDALKKASSLLGIGLDLGVESRRDGPRQSEPKSASASAKGKSTGNGNGSHLLTERQAKAIFSLASQIEVSEVELRTEILRRHGVPLEKLDRRQASELISAMQGRNAGGNGRLAAGGVS